MFLLGSLVNGLAIVIGGLLGTVLRFISEQTKETVTKGIGLGVCALGLQMSFKTDSFTLLLLSLAIGAMIGEGLNIEGKMNQFGLYLEKKYAKPGSNFASGFVTATLIFLIGSMGIIGAIESGVANNHQTLYTKAVMDGFLAIMLSTSLGVGVLFAAVPVFLYQGLIALLAGVFLHQLAPDVLTILMNEISGIGGLLMLGIGLNVLDLTKIRVSNYLPGILILLAVTYVKQYYVG